MFRTLIWATDGSVEADAALDEALRLTEPADVHIVAVHCDQRLRGRAGNWSAAANEDDVRLLIARHVERLADEGFEIELIVRHSHQDAADTVAAVAAELAADVIVCGTRGLAPLAGVFVGSFTQRLLHVAPCPVLAVRGGDPQASAIHQRTEVSELHV